MFFRWKYQDELEKQLRKYFEYQKAVYQDDVMSVDYVLDKKNVRKRPAGDETIVIKKTRKQ